RRRLQHWELRRFGALENPSSIDAGLAIRIGEACRVADQAAGSDIVTEVVDGRNGMARRQCNQRLTFAGEQWAADDHERASAGLDDACEGSIEFAFTPGGHRHNFLSDGAACVLHVARLDDRLRAIWINQCGSDTGTGNHLRIHLQPVRADPVGEERQAGQVAAGPVKAGYKTHYYWVAADHEHDRGGRGSAAERFHRWRVAYDHRHVATDYVGRQGRQLIQLIVRPPLLDRYVLALYESRLAQALEESCHDVRKRLGRCATEKPDHRHRRLLRARRERPRNSRAADKRDELATFH